MGKSQGTAFFVHAHLFFFPAKKLTMVVCSVLFIPQRAKGQPRRRPCVVPTGATWRHRTEESLGANTALSWDWPPAERASSPSGKPGLSFPFCLHCCQGQNKTKSKKKMLLQQKLKNTESSRQIALPVTKANPKVQLVFLNHPCKGQEKPTRASISSTELMPEHPVVPG